MSATVTTNEFIESVRKSGLFSDAQLEQYLKQKPLPPDARPETIAAEMVQSGLLTEFQARQILSGRNADFFIAGKYRILELLGKGGMGSVFLCEHLRMRRLVAVKILPPNSASDPTVLARFEREAQAIAAFDHPNVVHAHDIDQSDGRHFLVMEFVDGVDLQTLVGNHGPLSPALAAWCVAQTARGLHHAWLAGWVHRDIKPGNLLIDRDGRVKILDLGLARIFDAGSNLTSLFKESYVLGTADYLSPEQAAGNNETDIRADIYSLGATFYFLLVGKAPFEDASVSQKLLNHRTQTPLPVCLRRSDVPEALEAILSRMMQKDPRERYATPEEVADALMPFCTPPPPPPDLTQMPAWSPAVANRIRACQASSERPAPQTELLFKPGPKTELVGTGKIVRLTQFMERPFMRGIVVPYWLAVAVVLALLALIGWTIYRETHEKHEKTSFPRSAWECSCDAPASRAIVSGSGLIHSNSRKIAPASLDSACQTANN
jgi:eukaryotic-like serine/threonine-protein kinase